MGISMAKEALEDFRRYQADKDVNNRLVEVYNTATKAFEKRKWQDVQASPPKTELTSTTQLPWISWTIKECLAGHQNVNLLRFFPVLGKNICTHICLKCIFLGWGPQVGEILRVEKDTFFPADLLLISSDNKDGICYVETINLDGESNLKIKKAPAQTKDLTEADLAEFRVQLLLTSDRAMETKRASGGDSTNPC